MAYDLSRHPYFREYTDPVSGVRSYLLSERVASMQQNLYFTKMGGVTTDGRYLWFRCADWPSPAVRHGVVSLDPDAPEIRLFNHVSEDTSLLHPIAGTHSALFAVRNKVYEVDVTGGIREILTVDEDFIGGRPIERISTHLSMNSEGELITLDMCIGGKSYIAVGNYKTGEITQIHKFARFHNHAQFSPTDPRLFILDQDWERDPISGERFDIDQRIWLMDVDGTRLEPIDPGNWFRHNGSIYCHDFWSQDGFVCWPDLLGDVYEYDPVTRERTAVWRRSLCHCHTLDRRLWVGDASPYSWETRPCRVIFYDRDLNREIDIFSALPRPRYDRGLYHLDPHPAFSPDGSVIVSMTTVRDGEIDLAVTPVAPLRELCRTAGSQV